MLCCSTISHMLSLPSCWSLMYDLIKKRKKKEIINYWQSKLINFRITVWLLHYAHPVVSLNKSENSKWEDVKSRKVIPITGVYKKKKTMQGNNCVSLTETGERRKERKDGFQCFRYAHFLVLFPRSWMPLFTAYPHIIPKLFLKKRKK